MAEKLNLRPRDPHSLSDAWAVAIIVGAGLAAHGLLLFTNFIIWDGWWLTQELVYGRRFDLLLAYTQEYGRPMDYFYWRFLGLFPKPEVAIKFLALLAWVAAAVFMFKALRQLGGLMVVTACAIATMFVVCPAYKMMGESILFMNTASVAIFWAAWWMHGKSVAQPAVWKRIFVVGLFLASFNLNSLLAFYYAVGAALILLKSKGLSTSKTVEFAKLQFLKFPELVVLPVLYWVVKGVASPATGHHAGYNAPSLAPSLLLEGYSFMSQNLLVALLQGIFGSALQVLIAAVTCLLLAMGARAFVNDSVLQKEGDCYGRLAIMGLCLLAAAGLPYIAVGQNLASEGWFSRNSILVGMPVGMTIAGAFGWLNERVLPKNRDAWVVPASVFVLLCILACNRNVLDLEALGAKQESIRTKLRSTIAESHAAVVQLRDYFGIPGTIPYYPPVIWTYLAGHGDPELRTFVIDIAGMAPPQERTGPTGAREVVFPAIAINRQALELMLDQTTVPSFLRSIRREGAQRMFIVQQGKYGNDGAAIGARYLWLKWFEPDKLPGFLETLTETAVLELPIIGPA